MGGVFRSRHHNARIRASMRKKGKKAGAIDKQNTVKSPPVASFGIEDRGKEATASQDSRRPHTGGRRRRVPGSKPAGSIETSYGRGSPIDHRLGQGEVTSNDNKTNGLKGALHTDSTPTNRFSGLRPPWKAGESGNPAGRPRDGDIKRELREFSEEIDTKTGKSRLRVWLEICDRRARQGSAKHLEMLLDRGWGKPLQGVELDARLDFTDTLTRIRARSLQLPAPTPAPANGAAAAQTAILAASLPDDEGLTARDGAEPRPRMKVHLYPKDQEKICRN